MQITVSGVNVEVTPPLEEHARQKLDKVASHLSTITSVDVTLKIDNHHHIAEGNVLFPDHTIFAKADNPDMYHAIDELAKKLMAQVNKYKEKLKDHH